MNVIEKFGVKLTRMSEEDVEITCKWRNSPQVNTFMEYREPISLDMQQKWFASLDQSRQFYYIIHFKDEPTGVVNLKNYSGEENKAEGGIYIAEEKHQNTMVGYQAILAMYDFGFEELGLSKIAAHILKDNIRAIRFNQALGFVRNPEIDNHTVNQPYTLEKENYYAKTRAIRQFLGA